MNEEVINKFTPDQPLTPGKEKKEMLVKREAQSNLENRTRA